MSTKTNSAIALLLGVSGVGFGCGAAMAPDELLSARAAYAEAIASPAKQLAPVELDEARLALNVAEASFRDEGDEPITRDLAYISQRRSQTAMANGNVAAAVARTSNAHEERGEQRAELQRETSADLTQTRRDLAQERQRTATSGEALEREQEARATAEEGRTTAEATTAAALESLRRVANVKEEARGVVITLSGSVLFATGESDLLPIAQDRLRQVAAMLVDHRDQNIVVEGHTDSRGSAKNNMVLSMSRAESVRAFLVAEGVPAARIRAEGLGSSRPVGENDAAEGRANNRRVEIVVQPKGASAASASL